MENNTNKSDFDANNNNGNTVTITENGENVKNVKFIPKKLPQFLTAMAASLSVLCSGSALGWSSPGLPDLEDEIDEKPDIREKFGELTIFKKAMIASTVALGACLIGSLSGILMDKIGRRNTLMAITFPMMLGWILLFFSNGTFMMICARFILGICCGSITLVLPSYLSEIAYFEIRGAIGALFNTFNILGILSMLGLGIFLNWKWSALAGASFPLIHLITLFFIPESPRYLLNKGKVEDTIKALKRLRGASTFEEIKEEYDEMASVVERNKMNKITFKILFSKVEYRRPIILCTVLNVFQQLCGVTAILFYGVDIFLDSGSAVDANVAAVIVAGAVVCSFIFMDKAGRIALMLISEAGMCVGLILTGVYFYLLEHEYNGEAPTGFMGYFPLISIIIYFVSFAVGIGPIPSIIYSEIIPLHVKGLSTSFVIFFNWLTIFIVTFTFDYLVEVISEYGFFWFYAVMCIPSSLFIYFYIPETKGKTMEEIDQYLFSDIRNKENL